MAPEDFRYLVIAIVVGVAAGAYVASNWIRARHGYPLENQWGAAVHPLKSPEAEERVRLLTQETAQLRAELGAVKDRLATIERIVTDSSWRLDREFDALRGPAN